MEKFCITEYIDYRLALKNFYLKQKEYNKNFSHRYIAQRIGFSTGFFSQILNGKSNISQENINKFADLMGLNSHESFYFENLVNYNQTKDEKNRLLLREKLHALRRPDIKHVTYKDYDFYSEWYHSSVRELVEITRFRGKYAELAKKVYPSISEKQAEESVKLLRDLKLIERDSHGYFRKTDNFIKSGSPEHSNKLKDFVTSMMDIARDSIDDLPKSQRNISWQTISVNNEQYPEILDEIRAFRKRLMAIAQNSKNPNSVFQVNIQLFPVSKVK